MKIWTSLLFLFLLLRPLAAQTSAPSKPDDGVTMIWPNMPIGTVLDNYEKLSGKRTIRQVELLGLPNISINVPGKIPVNEALGLIESTLLLNNVAFVPFDDKSVKVVSLGGARNPRGEGLKVYASLKDLPAGESIVTFFLQLKYISAQDALNVLNPAVSPGPATYMLAVPTAQAMIIQEKTTVIRQLVEMATLIDVPPSRVTTEFVKLERADCEKVVEQVTKLIEARKAQNPQQTAPGQAQPPQQTEAVLKESGVITGDVQIIADVRTNRVLISTRPVNMDYFKKLVKEFDEATTATLPYERPLRYLKAGDVLTVLQDLLTEGNTQQAGTPNQPGQPNRNNTNNNRPQTTTTNSSSTGSSTNLGSLAAPDTDTSPQSIVVGKTRVIADRQANSILVIGPPENIDKVKNILAKLDKRPLQVFLSTVIGELTVGDDLDYSVDILKQYRRKGSFGSAVNSGGNEAASSNVGTLRGSIATSTVAALGNGLNVYGAIGQALGVYVQALQSTNRFQILSRPFVFTQNNKKATILSGSRQPVPSTTLTTANNTGSTGSSITSNIEYIPVELKLEVVPLINADNEITLDILQTNDTVGGTVNIGGVNATVINNQQLQTSITVANRSVIFLGGLVKETKQNDKTGVPFLSKIPVLGVLFGGTTKKDTRNELVVLLQPTVIQTDEDLAQAEAEERYRQKVYEQAERLNGSQIKRALPVK
jgi:type II secretion system protein D